MGESDGPDTVVRHMQIFAEQIDDLQADFAMLAEKMKQIFAPNVGHLQGLQGLGCDLVTSTGECSTHPQHLTCRSHPQGHAAAAFRTDG
jgi:hypothetical protein